jgi:hypothetical protein
MVTNGLQNIYKFVTRHVRKKPISGKILFPSNFLGDVVVPVFEEKPVIACYANGVTK